MQASSLRFAFVTALAFGALVCIGGCKSNGDSFNMSGRAAAWSASKQAALQELSQIPLPSKDTYGSIDNEAQWQNPFLSIQSSTIQVRIYLPDRNSSEVDRGGMTRLSAARKQTLTVRLKDLPRALSSLPDSAWPYGRVVAIGEALEAPQYGPQLRSNLAITASALKDMGIVVDNLAGRSSAP